MPEQTERNVDSSARSSTMPWYTGLQFRMYTSFVLLLLVIIGGTVGVALWTVGRAFRESVDYTLEQTGNGLVAELGQRLVYAEGVAHTMSLLGTQIARDPGAAEAAEWILGDEGRKGEILGCGVWFETHDGSPSPLNAVWRFAADGTIEKAALEGTAMLQTYRKRDWYAAARFMGAETIYWSLPYTDPFTEQSIVSCSVPFYTEQGRFAGVATADLPVVRLKAYFESALSPPNGYAFLVDRHNRFFYPVPGLEVPDGNNGVLAGEGGFAFPSVNAVALGHPDFRGVANALDRVNEFRILTRMLRIPSAQAELSELAGADLGDYPNADKLVVAMKHDPLAGPTKTTKMLEQFPLAHDPRLQQAATVSLFHVPRSYWRVVVVAPEEMATALARKVALRVLSPMVALVVIALLVAFLLVRRDLILPLRHMRGYLTGLSETEGDFLQGLGDTAPGELVELAYAFNHRTSALRASNLQLREEMAVRERAQIALRESEARFRNVLENTRDMLYQLNLDSMTYEYLSPAAREITGFSPGELNHMKAAGVAERIHPDDRTLVERHTRELVASAPGGEVAHEVEFRLKKKTGEYIWASENRTLIRDAEGRPKAIVASIRDVTARREAEAERTELRRYLRNIIDSMPSVIIGVDHLGRVTHWNQEAVRVTGYDPDAAEGRPFDQCFPIPEDYVMRVREAITTGEPMEAERFSVRDAQDEILTCDLIVYPLGAENADGAVIRIDDVSSRVQIEELMVQTEKMMSVGGLAAGMAHEINNPLGGILQACQNIDRRTSDELPRNTKVAESLGTDIVTIRKYLEERGILEFISGIKADGARAAKIVADMLAFSRQSESRFAPVNVAEMVDSVLRLAANDYDLKKHYDFRQVKIVRDFSPDLLEIRCEKTKVQQVLLNLIKNAAQALAENPEQQDPTLVLRALRADPYAQLEVEDNGPGMTEEVRRRVFDPFYTTKEVGVGTGLGLSVSYFIITKHHKGTMSVESTPGQGARFIMRLPLDLGV